MIESWNPVNKRHVARVISLLIDDHNKVPEYIQFFLVDRLLWASTEHDDNGKYRKYFGTPYWSRGAIGQVLANAKGGFKRDKNLIHEHSVPKCVLAERIDALWKEKRTSEADIHDLLKRFSHAAIVSRDEDLRINACGLRNKMPEGFSFSENDDVFSRYRVAGLELYKMQPADLELLAGRNFDNIETSSFFTQRI